MNFRSLFPARLGESVMTDVMVDIETTGQDPHHTGMIQLACIPYNYETEEIGTPFNRCLDLPPNRYWDESTKRWWHESEERREVLAGIIAKAEDPIKVINDFYDYIRAFDVKPRFWSRGGFDFNFIESYMKQFCLPMPFDFWDQRELRSHMAGLFQSANEPNMKWLTMEGAAHNALYDCVIQLKRLFSAKHGVFYEILPPEGQVA